MTMEERKAQARSELEITREAYLSSETKEAWIAFCEAKMLCMCHGVII